MNGSVSTIGSSVPAMISRSTIFMKNKRSSPRGQITQDFARLSGRAGCGTAGKDSGPYAWDFNWL